jgi:hypothetical protein
MLVVTDTVNLAFECKVTSVTGIFVSELDLNINDELEFQASPSVVRPQPHRENTVPGTASSVTVTDATIKTPFKASIVPGGSMVSCWHNAGVDDYTDMTLQYYMDISSVASDASFQVNLIPTQFLNFGTVDIRDTIEFFDGGVHAQQFTADKPFFYFLMTKYHNDFSSTLINHEIIIGDTWEWTDGEGKHLVMRSQSGSIVVKINNDSSKDVVVDGSWEVRVDPFMQVLKPEKMDETAALVDTDGFEINMFSDLVNTVLASKHTFSLWDRYTNNALIWGEFTLA